MGLAFVMRRAFSAQFLKADAQRHGGAAAGFVAGDLQHLPDKTHPILQRATVAVVSVVVLREQELIAQITHTGIHIKDVKACIEGAARGQALPMQHLVNVSAGHFFGPQLSHKAYVRCGPGNPGGGEWR